LRESGICSLEIILKYLMLYKFDHGIIVVYRQNPDGALFFVTVIAVNCVKNNAKTFKCI